MDLVLCYSGRFFPHMGYFDLLRHSHQKRCLLRSWRVWLEWRRRRRRNSMEDKAARGKAEALSLQHTYQALSQKSRAEAKRPGADELCCTTTARTRVRQRECESICRALSSGRVNRYWIHPYGGWWPRTKKRRQRNPSADAHCGDSKESFEEIFGMLTEEFPQSREVPRECKSRAKRHMARPSRKPSG